MAAHVLIADNIHGIDQVRIAARRNKTEECYEAFVFGSKSGIIYTKV